MTGVYLAPGFSNLDGTGLTNDMLASSVYKTISITIVNTARDSGSSPTTTLRRGLLMRCVSGNKYTTLESADYNATAVVLPYDIPNIDSGDVVVKAFYSATFKSGKLLDPAGVFVAASCQRLEIRDNV